MVLLSIFKCLLPSTGTVFGNGKTSDYLLLGNTVYTVSLATAFCCSINCLSILALSLIPTKMFFIIICNSLY